MSEFLAEEPNDYERRADMLWHELQMSVTDGFLTKEQADNWFDNWVAENEERPEDYEF